MFPRPLARCGPVVRQAYKNNDAGLIDGERTATLGRDPPMPAPLHGAGRDRGLRIARGVRVSLGRRKEPLT